MSEAVKEPFIAAARLQQAGCAELDQNPVSYLATWQHGNVKSTLSDARHIPGPDAHQ